MPLKNAKIRNLKTKEKSDKVSGFDGLFLLVKATGSKLWRFRYRIEGKEKLIQLNLATTGQVSKVTPPIAKGI